RSETLLADLSGGAVPQARLAHAPAKLGGAVVWLRRVELTGPAGFLVSTERANLPIVAEALATAGATSCPLAAFKAAEDKIIYSAVDSGFIAQNVYLYCASAGLNTVVRGMVDKKRLAKDMQLRDQQKIVLVHTVGYPQAK
ncbi:MAG: nitroreductase family protein, partial [Smithellaceae bacterium]